MSKYHDRSLALADPPDERDPHTAQILLEWGRSHGIMIPDAFVEWAALGGEEVLSNWSNTDNFSFTTPELVITPEGVQGLAFHRESQGNFTKIAVLDGTDDPQVLFGWLGEPPWTRFTACFSDCVYAQIFDWQYQAECLDTAYYDQVSFKSDECLPYLRSQFRETVSSRFAVDGSFFTEFRLAPSRDVRMTLLVNEPPVQLPEEGITHLTVTGEGQRTRETAERIMESLGPDCVPAFFSIPRVMAGEIARVIRHMGRARLRYMFVQPGGRDEIDALIHWHTEEKLEALFGFELPSSGDDFAIGGKQIGFIIRFRRRNKNWWWLQGISSAS